VDRRPRTRVHLVRAFALGDVGRADHLLHGDLRPVLRELLAWCSMCDMSGDGRQPDLGGRLLLTGAPGVGKTTVMRAVARALGRLLLGGFITEEIRVGRERQGFALVTFDGRRAIMAHVDRAGRPRVGKYGVDVAVIDEIAQSALAARPGIDLYLVDEIGKMECLSAAFLTAMRGLLDGDTPVVATIGQRGSSFIDEVKRRRDVGLWEITRANRDGMPAQVCAWVERHLSARVTQTVARPRRM
jgi:nucleoside-triphosphatase